MGIACYLAMTAREFALCPQPPAHPAWLDCHFSLYGTGLSGLPDSLPDDAMLILTDRVSLRGHLPEQVCDELKAFSPGSVLLDFQAPPTPDSQAMVRAICRTLPCPVAVTEGYGDCSDGPVLIAPPLHIPLEESIAPWSGRDLWLEVATEEGSVCVAPHGATFLAESHGTAPMFFDEGLCCGYRVSCGPESITFRFRRECSHLKALLQKAEALGIQRAVGLYQQLFNMDL